MWVGFEKARETMRDVVSHVRRDYTARADEQAESPSYLFLDFASGSGALRRQIDGGISLGEMGRIVW